MRAEVLSIRRVGAYHVLTVVAPGIASQARPGQFVTFAVGGPATGMLMRRAFSIHEVRERGAFGGTVSVVFAVVGRGTAWLAEQPPHSYLDVVGPLGHGFSLPREPATCTLVGGGYGSAPLFSLAEQLRSRGCRVDFVLGASTGDRLFGALDAKRMAATLTVTTDDGSVGNRGWVSDVLPDVLTQTRADVVYACGPMGMLRSVADIALDARLPCQVSVEELMACGYGVCMTCVLPIVGEDGVTRMVRSCLDGPVFGCQRVRFDAVGTVPPDAVGAPEPKRAPGPAAASAGRLS